jgi:hypothetical protein
MSLGAMLILSAGYGSGLSELPDMVEAEKEDISLCHMNHTTE